MAKTSSMVALGTPAPDFALPECTDGRIVRRDDFRDAPALLVMFICNHCPYVIHVREALVLLTRVWARRGVAVVAINPNDPTTHPDDSPERMAEDKQRYGYSFPYLFDASQDVALAYGAACTPDFFLYDSARKLRYRGQLDDARPANGLAVAGTDLGRAIDFVLEGKEPPEEQRPSMGCGIKWRPGKDPWADTAPHP